MEEEATLPDDSLFDSSQAASIPIPAEATGVTNYIG